MRNATNNNRGNEKAASNLQPNTAMKIEMDRQLAQVILETQQDLQTEPRPITAEDYNRMVETVRNMDDAEADRIRAIFA